jgi:tetratricopeptide (TPR) repeat protein
MGNELLRRKEYKQAVGAYSEALKTDPRNPTLFRNRAAAFANLGLWDDCLQDTGTVVQLMPNNRKAMLRHKAVVDFTTNFNGIRAPGYDRQNLTVANLLTPEEFTANNYTERLNSKPALKPPKVRTLTDPRPPGFYENGAPTTEPLQWAQSRGSRYFWETQLTSPEARKKHRGNASNNPGDGWTVNPEPTVIRY